MPPKAKTTEKSKAQVAYDHGKKLAKDGQFPQEKRAEPMEYRDPEAGSEKAYLRDCFFAGGHGEEPPKAPAKFTS